jgi:hypothetical protein
MGSRLIADHQSLGTVHHELAANNAWYPLRASSPSHTIIDPPGGTRP